MRNLATASTTPQATLAPLAHRHPMAIAADIRRHMPQATATWTFTRPYVIAMDNLDSWLGTYGCESAREIGLRFLCNAGQWKGPDAKRIKNDIRRALGMAEAK